MGGADGRDAAGGLVRERRRARPEAVVESVDEGERIVLRFDDDGVVDLRVVATDGGSLVEVRESTPSWSTAIEFRALSACAIR